MKKHKFSPETEMMGYGYNPRWSEGAVKCPVFYTSTFAFRKAQDGKDFFAMAHGRPVENPRPMGLIYSRINNPDMEILEERLKLWDGAAAAAVFSSGMSAISTTLLTFLAPGDVILYSNPLYGGTHKLINHILSRFRIQAIGFNPGDTAEDIDKLLHENDAEGRLKLIFVETPANPTNALFDIEMCSDIAVRHSAGGRKVLVVVDNTYMGPVWQHPLMNGADIVLYSATKYIGGHSDLIAGAATGSRELIGEIKKSRTFYGTIADPHTCWLLMRSLETLKIRMEEAARNARRIAAWLREHPKVEKVYYLGFLVEDNPAQGEILSRHCTGYGAMLSFDIAGGEAEAFTFLDHLKHIRLAVSLGGTESLAEHPFSMTHADVPEGEKLMLGITESMIRLSVGIENHADLIADMEQAFEYIPELVPVRVR